MIRLLPLALLLAAISAPGARAAGPDDALARALAVQERVRRTVARVRPAVVAVQVESRPDGGEPRGSGGSGVVVSREGHVLTNWHVVEGAERVTVIFAGSREVRARTLGFDPDGDLALLAIQDDEPRPHVLLGDSDGLRPGQWVLAMGNPRGVSMDGRATVTWGIVTALHCLGGGDAGRKLFYGDAIQTDAEINPGNSGGPLFDLDGRLVGINGRIATRDRIEFGAVNANVGFAIPAAQIRRFLPLLRKGGRVAHGFLGVRVDEDPEPGLKVAYVHPGAAAARAGVRAGDRLLALDGEPLISRVRLTNLVSSRPAGSRVALRIRRGGRERIRVVTLDERREVPR